MTPAFSALRELATNARRNPAAERCELCGAVVSHQHRHLIDPESRRLFCACEACSLLFPGNGNTKLKRVPAAVRRMDDFQLSEGLWDSLLIPIGLAFFVHSSAVNKVTAFYPSPAGATESVLSMDAWDGLLEGNPMLARMQPDVEALLVNRLEQEPAYYMVPIDKCFELVGLIRRDWHGLSGGAEMWAQTRNFFSELKEASLA